MKITIKKILTGILEILFGLKKVSHFKVKKEDISNVKIMSTYTPESYKKE
jgi:hypothetical protein